jgi:hypothetical protein
VETSQPFSTFSFCVLFRELERFVRFASFVWRMYASPSPQGDAACDLGILCEYQLLAYFVYIGSSPESDPSKLN